MPETDTQKQRMAVFLLVLLLHGILLEELIRGQKRIQFSRRGTSDALLVDLIARQASSARDVPSTESHAKAPHGQSAPTRVAPPSNTVAPLSPPLEAAPPMPEIDWQHELELSARNRLTDEEKEKTRRDLSKSMSASQLEWLKQHQMVPAIPGLAWKRPRVEVTKDGMPIVHVNDRCVLIPLLFVPMIFCSIGRMEPNGDLFRHMLDPKPLP